MRLASFSVCLLSCVGLFGCSSTALGGEPDVGRVEGDAGPGADAGTPGDDAATTPDAHVADAAAPEARCFPDVELVSLTGGREFVEPEGLFAYDGGWLAIYQASAGGGSPTGGTFERAAVFLDREGNITARQALLNGDFARGGRAVLGPFLFASQYDATDLFEIGDGELIRRTELLDPVPQGRVAALERDGDRLRILSQTWADPSAGSFRFAYSEIVLREDGTLTTLSAALPPIETIGSPALLSGLGRYHEIHSFAMRDDTFVFAFPTGERPYVTDGDAWNVVRVALDRSALGTGVASWSVIDETRWEAGPIAVFGALPDLDLLITGRWVTREDGSRVSRALAERWVPAAPPFWVGEDLFPYDQVGPATLHRRGDMLGIATPRRFVTLSLPSFEVRASAPIELGYGTITLWDGDAVLELGQLTTDDGALGVLRCHALR